MMLMERVADPPQVSGICPASMQVNWVRGIHDPSSPHSIDVYFCATGSENAQFHVEIFKRSKIYIIKI